MEIDLDTDPLPNTLHELLRIAVEDTQKIEKDPRYVLDMDVWHDPGDDGCHVCMAGAVMSNKLDIGPEDIIEPSDVATKDEAGNLSFHFADKLRAVDCLRVGDIWGAYVSVYGKQLEKDIYDKCKFLETLIRTSFPEGRDQANWETYLRVADKLEELGI